MGNRNKNIGKAKRVKEDKKQQAIDNARKSERRPMMWVNLVSAAIFALAAVVYIINDNLGMGLIYCILCLAFVCIFLTNYRRYRG